MHSHGSHRAGDPFLSIRVAEHPFGSRGPAGCKRGNGRPSPAQTKPDHIRMPHTEHSTQTWHEPLTVWLMNAIPERLAKTVGVAGSKRPQ